MSVHYTLCLYAIYHVPTYYIRCLCTTRYAYMPYSGYRILIRLVRLLCLYATYHVPAYCMPRERSGVPATPSAPSMRLVRLLWEACTRATRPTTPTDPCNTCSIYALERDIVPSTRPTTPTNPCNTCNIYPLEGIDAERLDLLLPCAILQRHHNGRDCWARAGVRFYFLFFILSFFFFFLF